MPQFGDAMFLGYCLDMAGTRGAILAAVATLHVSVGIAPALGLHTDPGRHERAVATAREALGAEELARAWAARPTISLDAAIAEVAALGRETSAAHGDHSTAADGLTPREGEVLRLLARGWSDQEIATALGIGRRTASTHVATIRAKLGAPSRSAAAAIAARDRLV